jgi:hypothetical protein
MIYNLLRYVLRLSIVALLALPLFMPFIEKTVERQPPRSLTVWIDSALSTTDDEQKRALNELRKKFSLNSNTPINIRRFGSVNQTPVQDYEELITQLEATDNDQIVIAGAALWGPAARNFNREVLQLAQRKNRKIFFIAPQDVNIRPARPTPDRFIALSELSAPQLNFLSEPSQLSLDIVGRLNPSESHTLEVVIRSGDALLTSKAISITADAKGLVNTIENIPVHFTRAQQQLLTAQLSSELSPVPLNIASTPVSVVHSKSTVLHIGVGPDWSLRNMRTKLKFWPNLDLLSYYILREISDDLSIPSNQLSLIEFPAEKLFGEQLPNFHGVLAQNFVFDSYLNIRDTENLYDYISASGGRMVIQAGPLSFLGANSKIKDLFPCENIPEFDFDKPHAWRVGKNRFLSEAQFEASVEQIVTKQTALGCKPKQGALVLAETTDNPPSPMIIAYPVGKGLVVAFLAGDWHTSGTQTPADTASQRAHRVYAVDAGERLFQWMVEFLQRRQDSGLRPPHFAGPRLYRNDPLHLVRSRGGLPENILIDGYGRGFSGTIARPVYLARLGLEGIQWERLNAASASSKDTNDPINPLPGFGRLADQELSRAPAFESIGLGWRTAEFAGFASGSQNQAPKPLVWPLFEGTMREREGLANPTLIPAKMSEAPAEFSKFFRDAEEFKERQNIPLLSAFPWILAFVFALLAVEQLLTRLAQNSTRQPNAGRQ